MVLLENKKANHLGTRHFIDIDTLSLNPRMVDDQ